MSFKLSLWKTMNTVATQSRSGTHRECKSCVLVADSKVDGADQKKPLSQGEMQICFGVDKGTVGSTTAPAPPLCPVYVLGPL
jgi:hypothetical protein